MSTQLRDSVLADRTSGAPLLARSETLMAQGRYEDAADTLRACITMRQKGLPDGHWLIADTVSRLGAALAAQRKFAEAESVLLKSSEQLQANRQATAEPKRQAVERIVKLYEAWDRPDQAASWRQRLQEFNAQPAAPVIPAPADGSEAGD